MYLTNEEKLKEIKKKIPNNLKNKTLFFFRKVEELNFWAKEYYMKNADDVNIIKNLLDKDNTINYKVTYNINRIEDIFNMQLLNNYNDGIWVKNYSLQDILGIVTKGSIYNRYKNNDLDIKPYIQIFEEIQKKFNKNTNETIVICESYLKEYKLFNQLNEIICWNYRMNKDIFKDSMEAVILGYDKRDETLRKIMGLPKDIKLKNAAELTLYKIVKDIFPDAIYQYRSKWLGKQSLDIFIPSKNIGIEYQGQQHYESIFFFGGQEKLKKQQALDNKKRELCNLNNVKLVEWKYTDWDFSKDNILKKIIC